MCRLCWPPTEVFPLIKSESLIRITVIVNTVRPHTRLGGWRVHDMQMKLRRSEPLTANFAGLKVNILDEGSNTFTAICIGPTLFSIGDEIFVLILNDELGFV